LRKTTNLREFLEAWRNYADNLSILALHAEVPYEEYERIRGLLNKWIDLALLHQVKRCDEE